jgi:predicted nucleotidyltransferase
MNSKALVINRIKETRKEAEKRYKVRIKGIFGSFIKEEAKRTSDVDVLVDFKKGADLFDYVGLSLFLEEKLNRKVDVVSEKYLRSEFKKQILKETVYL